MNGMSYDSCSHDPQSFEPLLRNPSHPTLAHPSFSCNLRPCRSPEEMRAKLSVHFQGEEGIDAGGVSREWYQVSYSLIKILIDLSNVCGPGGLHVPHDDVSNGPSGTVPRAKP